MKKVEVAPSILNANFANLENEIKKVADLGVKYLHYDVMDGHFVPNISFGAPIVASVSKLNNLINDVHLMIENPVKYIFDFKNAGADIITFHIEACHGTADTLEIIKLIKSLNIKCGISIKPFTPLGEIEAYLPLVDLVLVMSVEPGFGGQKFNETALTRIKMLDEIRKKDHLDYLIEVDGGINDVTAKKCAEAGVDILVCGTYLYRSKNIKEDYEKLLS
ncbi:MAG: ribulose-phosphate 3-epimerase [Bacilli bacterium]|nr:ribulose-phosphate 3-epimerase [Bacilli bacterium]